MEDIVSVAMLSRRLLLEEPEMAVQSVTDRDQIETYIALSIKNAFTRTLQEVETTADARNEHPLALLAEQTKNLLKKDDTMFLPILSQRHPQATVVSASLLHKLYGNKLKPFIDGAEHLTEDVVSVFPAADSLEQYVMALIMSVCEDATAESHSDSLVDFTSSVGGFFAMAAHWTVSSCHLFCHSPTLPLQLYFRFHPVPPNPLVSEIERTFTFVKSSTLSLGLDIKWWPNNCNHENLFTTLQLCVGCHCLNFHPNCHDPIPPQAG
ncbi:hypothetical protein TEA_004160 [Camellia sinensis var. sinensis]|uniref:Uncharacterized protein n=1 Tax=Camellia sinensis var. sinensis TaxID=542762 RepID=A0A4S4E377_CAMSN|nr:hypothetical protein TEA_004160 [Camellia sinensis var. sinensis]